MVYLPTSGNWGCCGRRGLAWKKAASVRQQEGGHLVLSPAKSVRVEPAGSLLVFLSTVCLQLRVGCALHPGILPIWLSYSISLGFTLFICKVGRTGSQHAE